MCRFLRAHTRQFHLQKSGANIIYSAANECGNVNVAQTLAAATPITAAADGTFSTTITNFNAGQDGSRQVTAQIDPTGTGKSFVAGTVTQNGDLVRALYSRTVA